MDMVNTPCDMCKGCTTPNVKICIIVLGNAILERRKCDGRCNFY